MVWMRIILKDFKLSKEEQKTVVDLFHTLVMKHLPEFDKLRKKLLKEVPPFLAEKLEDIKKIRRPGLRPYGCKGREGVISSDNHADHT